MQSPWLRTVLVSASLLAFCDTPTLALGNHRVAETVYIAPTETVWTVPTSYVLPTSYVVPASYLVPSTYAVPTVYSTAYLSTAYDLLPTSYIVPTTYYRATSYYLPRRTAYRAVYPTTRTYYVPTTTYYTTLYDLPIALAASTACDEVALAPAAALPAQRTPRGGGTSMSTERPPSSEVESMPAGTEPVGRTAPQTPPEVPPPPAVPAAPARAEDGQPAAANPNSPAGAEGDLSRRVVQRPPLLSHRNILAGEVIAHDTNRIEENVRVIASDRLQRYTDRVATTDAFGRYAIRLPDGDWTVKVAMPSGRIFAVYQITAGGGLITDETGRDVSSLKITR
jgi:hypothetical protein